MRYLPITLFAAAAAIAPAALAAEKHDGPREARAIHAETVGVVDLGAEIPATAGRNLRLRLWTLEPDGVVPVHSHANRPAMIYFLGGKLIEHGSDKAAPTEYRPDGVSLQAQGVSHRWETNGDVPVKMLAIDIYQDAI